MSQLIKNLKEEHQALLSMLENAKEKGIATAQGQELVLSAKEMLLGHLGKEDKELYPPLNKAAENNNSLKRTMDLLADEMTGITDFAINFFTKYETTIDKLAFAMDFGKLYSELKKRIRREETTLYIEFMKI